ncbi:Hypothetical predicted protein [Mytilus galloprovincialis]|uniref:Uncharacterized protein n=1 Tax=Mytilus galloprovincialis TaxID=29158 RepID=A0A8B6CUU1_MYTGA|nr:Hypothetical predicted protein [Mytilus galloprovincialis]
MIIQLFNGNIFKKPVIRRPKRTSSWCGSQRKEEGTSYYKTSSHLDTYVKHDYKLGKKEDDTTCKLFTRAFHEHLEQSPGCYGNFQFDNDAEEQRTMCWREKVGRYETAATDCKTSIGALRVPNRHQQNVTLDTTFHCLDLEQGPRLPGTQATTTIVENATARKLSEVNWGKCNCTGRQGHCSANFKPWDSYCNEELYGELLAEQLAEDEQPLVIGQLTRDWDSHAYRGFSKKHSESVNLTPENLRDPRHLASTQLRSIDKAAFSEFMFDGRTKANREKIQRRFSFDLTDRCTVEYNFAFKESAGK